MERDHLCDWHAAGEEHSMDGKGQVGTEVHAAVRLHQRLKNPCGVLRTFPTIERAKWNLRHRKDFIRAYAEGDDPAESRRIRRSNSYVGKLSTQPARLQLPATILETGIDQAIYLELERIMQSGMGAEEFVPFAVRAKDAVRIVRNQPAVAIEKAVYEIEHLIDAARNFILGVAPFLPSFGALDKDPFANLAVLGNTQLVSCILARLIRTTFANNDHRGHKGHFHLGGILLEIE